MNKSMRAALLATAVLNMFGAGLMTPVFPRLREIFGLPDYAHPLYLWIISSWIFFFGLSYLRLAVTGKRERLFLIIAAAGSMSDLFFGLFFLRYLWQTRNAED